MRLLFVVHGHPQYSKGGAEVACYNLFKAALDEGHDAFLIAGVAAPTKIEGVIEKISPNEFLVASQTPDYFFLQSGDPQATSEFEKLLIELRPEVIHFHHFIHLGLDWLALAKATVPSANVVLTLHEYYAICANDGQMVMPVSYDLCYESSPKKCGECIGRNSDEMLFRELMFKGSFSRVDHFVSPSLFLKERYVAWGLLPDEISVIENGLDLALYKPKAEPQKSAGSLRIAYFGQMTPFKGVDILLDALLLLPEGTLPKIQLKIHGANLSAQRDDYKSLLSGKIMRLGKTVELCGRYESHEFSNLAGSADYMVMPSRWWENSPMVIQEARACNIPIIVSDIGGMREKVVPGKNGLWFDAGSAVSLAALLETLIDQRNLESFEITEPLGHKKSLAQHLIIYQGK